MGDQLLISVARRLKETLRSSDTIARFGGDEFEVLLDNTVDENSVLIVAEKIRAALHSPFKLEGREVYMTASIGIVINLAGYERAGDILRDADIAMYQAKASGKDRYEIFDVEMRTQAFSRLEMENEIRKGLENREFQLYYQPIMLPGIQPPGRVRGPDTLASSQTRLIITGGVSFDRRGIGVDPAYWELGYCRRPAGS